MAHRAQTLSRCEVVVSLVKARKQRSKRMIDYRAIFENSFDVICLGRAEVAAAGADDEDEIDKTVSDLLIQNKAGFLSTRLKELQALLRKWSWSQTLHPLEDRFGRRRVKRC